MSRFSILMFHMVNETATPKEVRYAVTPDRFEAHIKGALAAGYTFVSPIDIERHLKGGRPLPDRSVLVSIDDGFEDNYENAFPVLRHHGVPAVIFLATARIAGHNDWMASTDYPQRPMLTWDQVREMRANGIFFGGHTMTHPRLSSLGRNQALNEIAGCAKELEEQTGESPNWFAYPYGDLDEDTPDIVKEAGFSFACTTRSGFNNDASAHLLLRRLEVYGTDSTRTLLRKLRFGSNDVSMSSLMAYYLRRAGARIGLEAS